MKLMNHTLTTTVLAAMIGAASIQGPAAIAAEPVDMNIREINGKVHLIVQRKGVNNETRYEQVIVPADEADNREAELLLEPNVISVDRDIVTYSPIPLSEPAPSYSRSQAVTRGQNTDAAQYSDPLFNLQEHFDVGETFNTRLSEAHGRLSFDNTIRVGIVDGGFIRSSEVTYVEGASQNYGKGADFYNDDPGIECPFLANGAEKDTHGDWVAQVLGANTNNGLGIAGAAQNVELVAARSMSCTGVGTSFENAESVRWLAGDSIIDVPDISEPVDVINMSLSASGSLCPAYMQDAIDYATARGIIVVVAAGNDSEDTNTVLPANCDGVVTVAATTSSGGIASYSNFGDAVDIAAQGSGVTVLDNGVDPINIFGTSFATPIVAGAIASALSDRPNLTPAEVLTIVSNSGKAFSTSGNTGYGVGILDAMLFLDGAGVARDSLTFDSALGAEREQFLTALLHPAASAYIQAQTGATDACEIYEVNGEALSEPTADDSIAVFSVAAGEPLDPTNGTASIIASTTEVEDLVISQSDIDTANGSNRQLGVAHCNLTTGANCSVKDTVKTLDTASVTLPNACT
ncbi:hypothetical protein AWH63_10095 [Marinobacter sp. C18]|uniref:S8 family serine peptidase n=1 Tax=Marinobacter sp. C18 TaxID=1772288 RepID=UPI000948D923|nr:S8 family serine peptidase [Marinobacter sp. C18]OLF81885.1 hypothetical protein AWH63_10095 [Marinobacter sp. C18]